MLRGDYTKYMSWSTHQILFEITSRNSKTGFQNYIICTFFFSPVWQRAQLNRDSSFNQSHDSSSKSLVFRSFAADSFLNFSFSPFCSRGVHQTSRSAQNFNEIVSNIASCQWFSLIESISLLFYLPTSFRLWLRARFPVLLLFGAVMGRICLQHYQQQQQRRD